MLHYWLSVFLKTFWDSWAFTDRTPAGLAYWLIVLAVTIGWLIKQHGWRDALKHFWRTSGEGILIGLGAYALVLLGHFVYEPFHLQQDEIARRMQVARKHEAAVNQYRNCQSDFKAERVRTDLLSGQITSQQTQISQQQTLIAGQQNISAKEQSTFDLCVATLAQTNAPIPFKTTMLVGEYPPFSDTKHTSLMLLIANKPVTPARVFFWCDTPLKHAVAKPFGDNSYSASAKVLSPGRASLLSTQRWQLDMSSPNWSPEQPILVMLGYDEDQNLSCYANL